MAILNYSHIYAAAGFSGETFDISAGPANTGVIDTLLSAGDGALTCDAPHALLSSGTLLPAVAQEVTVTAVADVAGSLNDAYWDISSTTVNYYVWYNVSGGGTDPAPGGTGIEVDITTGASAIAVSAATQAALNAYMGGAIFTVPASATATFVPTNVVAGFADSAPSAGTSGFTVLDTIPGSSTTLSIAGMEVESAAEGSQSLNGRFFFLTVQNSNISAVNTITVSGSTSINGDASLVINEPGDWMFTHLSGGVWRANMLPTPGMPGAANMIRVPFTTAEWAGSSDSNHIVILQTGSPGAGEAGPHNLPVYDGYVVTILNTDLSPNEYVDVEIQQASNGNITLRKAPRAPAFNGTAMIIGTND